MKRLGQSGLGFSISSFPILIFRFYIFSVAIFFMQAVVTSNAFAAAELDNVKIADDVMVEKEKLVLNGYATRKVQKFGFPIKVYVGALYLTQKNQNSDQILQSPDVKQLLMTFVRGVDRETLIEAYRTGYNDACVELCADKGKQFAQFKPHVQSMGPYGVVRLTFWKDKMRVEFGSRPAAEIADPALAKNFLNIFINEKKPPTKEFRQGLLGLPKP